MMLPWLIFVPLIGGVLAWLSGRRGSRWPRWVTLAVLAVELILLAAIWSQHPTVDQGTWLASVNWQWIPRFGIAFHLAIDGLSVLLVLLTIALGAAAVVASWTEIQSRSGFFYFNILWTVAGVVGVFLALDLFLFFFLWEAMLVPMYFIIAVWGHERRVFAAIKFFLFTQGSGLLMLLAILALVFVHHQATGVYTFDYFALLHTPMGAGTAFWLMLGFFVAFAVKLPALPFHTWLPDAHTQAPTGGSVLLAGILLKTGAYGLLRFVVPLFPEAAHTFAPAAMALGVIGILYGAVLAFAQVDFKRLVAYTSVSHMGFILLGVFAWNDVALLGVVMQIIAHGLSTGALFMIAGSLQERLHTRDTREMGGLWTLMPRMGAVTLFFAIASLGLPGLANFVAEFMILLGAYQVNVPLTVLAAIGLITAAVYALVLVQRAFQGGASREAPLRDYGARDMGTMGVMIVVLLWLGLYPQPLFDTAAPALVNLRHYAVEGGREHGDHGE